MTETQPSIDCISDLAGAYADFCTALSTSILPSDRIVRDRLTRDVPAEARALLQVANHAEEVLGLRIAARSEHADQALWRRAGRFAKLFKADGRLDVTFDLSDQQWPNLI